jgi:Fur family peroxide stress response transcriptional regulator
MTYTTLLKEKNLKSTPQRLSILEALYDQTHPTIDELYAKVREKFPDLSLATIYKNLALLKAGGAIMEIPTPNGQMRYDIYLKPHAHIVCKHCGQVEDAALVGLIDKCRKELVERSSHTIKRVEITAFVDHCSHCKPKLKA